MLSCIEFQIVDCVNFEPASPMPTMRLYRGKIPMHTEHGQAVAYLAAESGRGHQAQAGAKVISLLEAIVTLAHHK